MAVSDILAICPLWPFRNKMELVLISPNIYYSFVSLNETFFIQTYLGACCVLSTQFVCVCV